MTGDFPTADMALTHILVVQDLDASCDWYANVLGASLYREYGGDSAVFQVNDAWLVLVTAGDPTPDKPGIFFEPPRTPDIVSHSCTIRVTDCQAAYDTLRARGASFLTPPFRQNGEIRCFFRDPDGHLFEISEVT